MSIPLRVLICDDELMARKRVTRLLGELPGNDGIDTVMEMPEERPYVIFLTAHPEHAVKAFDVGAVDYVLKPVDDARLEKALSRARHSLDHGGGAEGPSAAP